VPAELPGRAGDLVEPLQVPGPAIPAQRRPPSSPAFPRPAPWGVLLPPGPAIPAQRRPPSSPAFPRPAPWGVLLPPGASSRRRVPVWGRVLVAVLVAVGVVAGVVTAVVTRELGASATAEAAARPAVAPARPSAVPLTPYEKMGVVLKEQAAALLRGDVRGWLAAVDPRQPKLRGQYQTMFRSLRGLSVSQFEYYPSPSQPDRRGVVVVDTDIRFCFGLASCPPEVAPRIGQKLTMAQLRGRYVITRLARATHPSALQPTPWESGSLVFRQGKRVILAAAPSEAEHLGQVAALADKAAQVTDRFAGYVGNPQRRYRVFLADAKAWRTWYGGDVDKTTIGLEIPLNQAESDVVLRMSALRDPAELARTLQHEMGHVATVGGARESGQYLYQDNQWLSEGVAEYIEWLPRGATASYRRGSVRMVLHGTRPPHSIAAKPLSAAAGDRTIDAFYGLGHFAVDCMAQTYGQRRLFDFIRLRLRQGEDLDQASRHAYGKPFATIDTTCVAWIRQHA
jgi:hypothetical protein